MQGDGNRLKKEKSVKIYDNGDSLIMVATDRISALMLSYIMK